MTYIGRREITERDIPPPTYFGRSGDAWPTHRSRARRQRRSSKRKRR